MDKMQIIGEDFGSEDGDTLVARLGEYAKDWRNRAGSKDVVDEAAEAIIALRERVAELEAGLANGVKATSEHGGAARFLKIARALLADS